MSVRPLHDRVLVERTEVESTTAGGIILHESAVQQQDHGKVLAVGKGRLLADGTIHPLEVRVGDKVLFGRHSGTDISVDEDVRLVLREDDIIAVLD